MAAETLLTRIFNYIKESVVIKRLEWLRVGNKYWSPVQAGTGFLEKLLTFYYLITGCALSKQQPKFLRAHL